MYQIIGVDRSGKETVMATPGNAGEALTHYRASQALFSIVKIIAPDGEQISGFELSRRFEAEERERYS